MQLPKEISDIIKKNNFEKGIQSDMSFLKQSPLKSITNLHQINENLKKLEKVEDLGKIATNTSLIDLNDFKEEPKKETLSANNSFKGLELENQHKLGIILSFSKGDVYVNNYINKKLNRVGLLIAKKKNNKNIYSLQIINGMISPEGELKDIGIKQYPFYPFIQLYKDLIDYVIVVGKDSQKLSLDSKLKKEQIFVKQDYILDPNKNELRIRNTNQTIKPFYLNDYIPKRIEFSKPKIDDLIKDYHIAMKIVQLRDSLGAIDFEYKRNQVRFKFMDSPDKIYDIDSTGELYKK